MKGMKAVCRILLRALDEDPAQQGCSGDVFANVAPLIVQEICEWGQKQILTDSSGITKFKPT